MNKRECDKCRYWSRFAGSKIGACSIHGIHTAEDSPACRKYSGHVKPIRVSATIRQRPKLTFWLWGGTAADEVLQANYEDGDEVWLDISLRESNG